MKTILRLSLVCSAIVMALSQVAYAENNESVSYLDNVSGVTDIQPKQKRNIVSLGSDSKQGLVYGMYPFYRQLGARVWIKNQSGEYELATGLDKSGNPEKVYLQPGMILDIAQDLDAYSCNRDESATDANLPLEDKSVLYAWCDLDAGDVEADFDDQKDFDANKNIRVQWYVLTLKPGKNWTDLDVAQTYTSQSDVWNGSQGFDAKPIDQAYIKDNQDGGLTPSYGIEIPALEDNQRIGFTITPVSKYGMPRYGYQMRVWDISKLWGQSKAREDQATREEQYGNDDFDAIFINRAGFNQNGLNLDFGHSIGDHPIIASPDIQPDLTSGYRVRIFDKRYFDENSGGLRSEYDLTQVGSLENPSSSVTDWQRKGFYVNQEYVALIDLKVEGTNRARKLTRREVEDDTQDIQWILTWHHQAKFGPEDEAQFTDKPYEMIYHLNDESGSQSPRILVKYKVDSGSPDDEVEYILFRSQTTNQEAKSLENNKVNPERGEQSFTAELMFGYDPEKPVIPSMLYEIEPNAIFMNPDGTPETDKSEEVKNE